MAEKKIAVRYLSRGGNTKAAAEAIAKAAGVEAKSVEVPLDGTVDILFIGSGVYALNVDQKVKEYLEALNSNDVKDRKSVV
jgi:flavodoxin